MDDLINRLRGQYGIGPNREFGTRSFSEFIPPICLEAANEIEELNRLLNGYKKLAEERGDFIINGEHLGYISVPESIEDSAYQIFMRCKLTDDFAAENLTKIEDENNE